MPDLDRLERIIAILPAEDGAWLSGQLEPPWKQRARRLAERDRAIAAVCANLFPIARPTVAAKSLARAWARYLDARWQHERYLSELPPDLGAAAQHVALHELTRMNDGCCLGWRAIYDVLPRDVAEISGVACNEAVVPSISDGDRDDPSPAGACATRR